MLDLESVQLFVLAADLGNLTRAAEAAGTVQPVVSQRLKALEAVLGRRLLDRTPRYVRLTAEGKAFLDKARDLLAAHEAALSVPTKPLAPFSVGFSDHALGSGFEDVLCHLRSALGAPVTIELKMGHSQDMRRLYEAGSIEAAIIRREVGGADGEVLGRDPLGWCAASDWANPSGESLPLLLLAEPCGVRSIATRALDRVGVTWRETFVGGGTAALVAAARAGLGVAPMGRIASGNLTDRGRDLGLPTLPASEIVLLARSTSDANGAAVRALAAAIRSQLRQR